VACNLAAALLVCIEFGSLFVVALLPARDKAARDASKNIIVIMRIVHPGYWAARLMRALAVSPMLDNNHEVSDDKS